MGFGRPATEAEQAAFRADLETPYARAARLAAYRQRALGCGGGTGSGAGGRPRMGRMSELHIHIQERLWERGQLEVSAEFFEAEAKRPASNPVYAAFCAAQAKRLREAAEEEAAEPCPDESP